MIRFRARLAPLLLAAFSCTIALAQPPLAPRPAMTANASSNDDQKRAPLKLDGRALPLGGALNAPQAWQTYKQRFITSSGRVVDTANGQISHSEGQGYGMLLAVAANDRPTFDRLWGWTRANLMVRDDQLIAWRWTPGQRPPITDMNNATDGDILIAWALAEAAELWGDAAHRAAARRIAVEVARKTVMFKTANGAILLPGVLGFSAGDRPDGPVINLSYYVFPAFARLATVAPEVDWNGLIQTGLDQIRTARFGESKLPTDWISLRGDQPKPADGFPRQFSYNAIRIPLYMAWAGVGDWDHYSAFHAWAHRSRGLATIDVDSGRDADRLAERGYGAIGALLACAVDRKPAGSEFRTVRDSDNYYSVTLQLLAMAAANMRYNSCQGS
ncbi:MAG: glycosyl hydrolase family 8 [Beijerinckiaceae bacterium]